MKKLLNIKFLLLIVILAGFLRFYNLGNNPPTLNWDEAAFGYNAYTLGIDGRDEFGRKSPLDYLESYGDFKPPLYAYLDVIPVKILGLNTWGVRFPSALLGTLTVLLTYFLVKEIFYKKKLEHLELFALLSSFFLAISPWHIMLSRGAFEANVATFLLILGILLFIKAANKNPYLLILSAISFGLSIYTFNTARIFAPLMAVALAFLLRKHLLKYWKITIVSFMVAVIMLIPTTKFLLSPEAGLRFREVNIFSNLEVIERSNQMIINDDNKIGQIIHNRRILFSLEFLKHYFDNLNPSFLFIKGDQNPRFSTKDLGQMYLWDLPFVVIGIFMLFRRREGHFLVIPVWILLGIIPAAMARETPHALRIETIIPTLQILSALGFVEAIGYIKKRKKLITGALISLLLLNFAYFYHGLLIHYVREYSQEWQYTYKEVTDYVKKEKGNYDHVSITNILGRPYVYFLIAEKTDPSEFRKDLKVTKDSYGFVNVESYGKYYFSLDPANPPFPKNNTLFIVDPRYVPNGAKILKKFARLDGKVELVAYEL